MNFHKKIVGIVLSIGIAACTSNSNSNELLIDSTLVEIIVDSIQPIEKKIAFIDSSGYTNTEAEITDKIVEKYGKQWDFCDCIVKNDSIEKAIFATEDDNQLTLILDRSEVIDKHCKELLTAPNTTPEQRAKHDKKVQKCLRDAARRKK